MASTPPILNRYAPLSHKAVMQGTAGRNLVPTWVPEDEHQRLAAYKVLAAYCLNDARDYLPADVDQSVKDGMREFGDAALIRNATRAGVLGEGPQVVVDGADANLPDEPDLPDLPDEPTQEDGEPDASFRVRQRVYESRLARWEAAAEAAVEEWERTVDALPQLQARQDWLRQWMDDEQAWAKVHEAEGDSCGLGDGLYTLTWSSKKRRPVLRVYDPGHYFPVLDERAADEGFPRKVHVAWEFERVEGTQRKQYVRRLTWELVEAAVEARRYPWQTDGEEPSTTACLFSDGTWDVSDMQRNAMTGLYDISDSAATWAVTEDGVEAYRIDLGHDFLPVIHLPCTPDGREHFGSSVLLVLAQLLDELHRADTDLRDAAALSAGPVLAMSGYKGSEADGTPVKVRPGMIHRIPEGGRMDVLDLTGSLPALQQVADSLRDLMSVNGRIPGAALGRIDPGQAPSGVALALLFSPFGQLVGELRLARAGKYALLFKLVQRLAMLGGALEAGPVPTARMAWGPFLPTDLAAVVGHVATLLQAGAISTQTAVSLLVAAGVGIEDAEHEVDRIRSAQGDTARAIADATGSEQAAADFLGIDLGEQPAAAAPTIALPGAGTTETGA